MNSRQRVEAYFKSTPLTQHDREQIIIGWKLAQDDGERMLSPAAIEQWKSDHESKVNLRINRQ